MVVFCTHVFDTTSGIGAKKETMIVGRMEIVVCGEGEVDRGWGRESNTVDDVSF